MLHSFVVAKLLPVLPAWATYGQRTAASLVTTPFLALRVHESEDFVYRAPNIFVISREKPTLPGSQYLTLPSTPAADTNALTVTPSLPFKGPLYLHITPRVSATFPEVEQYEKLCKSEKYQLDEPSIERFRKALEEAGPSILVHRSTGGTDEPAADWDTWSGQSPREAPGPVLFGDVQLSFEVLPFETLRSDFDTHVYDEIPLLRQLVLDYTWEGCRLITDYIETLRKALPRFASERTFRPPTMSADQECVLDAQQPSTSLLQSLPVIHDGDPATEGVDEWELADDLKDEEMPILEMHIAEAVSSVAAGKIKVVVFDANALLDRDGPLREALIDVFPPSKYSFSAKELLDLYVEYESLQSSNGQPESPLAVIQQVAKYLDASVPDCTISEAMEHCGRPRLSPFAQQTIDSVTQHGCVATAMPSTATKSALLPLRGLSLDLFDIAAPKPPLSWDTVLSYCKQFDAAIEPNQVLVVTPDLYRVCESAGRAGFSTALLKVEHTRSAKVAIPTIATTYTLAGLGELLSILQDPTQKTATDDPIHDPNNPPFRIRDTYQCTFLLGTGSFAYVWSAVEVHTGAGVAIKFELIHPTDPQTLPYEAAIYMQLKGVQGVPRLHWSGQDMNANVLVMDKLGPNLEQLRRFCRGKLSVKTVLMLGEQMLSTIERVHSRGIVVRDIKPENFALGLVEEYQQLYLFDLGLSKLYVDPRTGEHMPFRNGRGGIGTPRYASHNVHLGLEPSRRDDVEAIGNLLLYLLHGRLPWQGIYAPDIPAKLARLGEMKRGKPFTDLLSKSPEPFTPFFQHCRSLQFADKPDYAHLRRLLRGAMEEHGWTYDWEYDWLKANDRGTLLPEEYRLDMELVEPVRKTQHIL